MRIFMACYCSISDIWLSIIARHSSFGTDECQCGASRLMRLFNLLVMFEAMINSIELIS